MNCFLRQKGLCVQSLGVVRIVSVAFILGVIAGICVAGIVYSTVINKSEVIFSLATYILIVHVLFHFSEFVIAARLRPHDTDVGSFMIFHSIAYVLASGLAFVEFGVKLLFGNSMWYGQIPSFYSTSAFGFITLFFYGVRVVAMIQCGSHFSLQIEEKKRDDHVLVTTGLYKILRHPAYFGWFWRTLFAQLVLRNCVCCVAHTATTWLFFKRRIPYEESLLESDNFFGSAYKKYKSKTYVGIPFL